MRRKNAFGYASAICLAGIGAACADKPAETAATPSEKPNIIFILCDDLGYGDLACYGQKYIETPNLDRMAAEGMLFTQAYAGSPVSAPSRASLMTGQHTGHCKIRGNKEYWSGEMWYGKNREFTVTGQMPYDTAHVILPEIMKANGYTTGMFGKWAGGYEGSESTPDKRGVDEFFGYICQFQAHLYFPNFLNRYSRSAGDSTVVRVPLEQNIRHAMYGDDYRNRTEYSADLIHQKALEWLRKQDGEHPFYGFFTYTLPHAELTQPQDSIVEYYMEKFRSDKNYPGSEGSRYNPVMHTHAQFAAMITRLDAYVGEVMQVLEEKNLAGNTVLLFSSDNGPHEEGGADPEFFGRDGKLRGLKRQCYEGGIRVPFLVRWPGRVEAGAISNHICAFYDILPTFCELIGEKDYVGKYGNPNLHPDYFDGISFLPTLLGDTARQKQHEFLYWEFEETDQIGVRMADWKMVVKQGVPHLYNLGTDLHEDNDVAKENPEVVNEMLKIIATQHVENPDFKVTLPH